MMSANQVKPRSRRMAQLLEQAQAGGGQPRLTREDVRELERNRAPAVRARIARKFGGQYDELADGSTAQLAQAVLALLVGDIEKEVRKALAETVAASAKLPPTIAEKLARDDIEVARPVLEKSPVLSDDKLAEIVRTNSVQYALAVAGRERISEQLADALVDTGQERVVAKLAGNLGAELTKRTLKRILEDFRSSRRVQDRLVRRPALPHEITEELVSIIGDRIEWELVKTRRISPEEARAIVSAVRERVTLGMTARDNDQESLLRYFRGRHLAGELGPDELLGYLRDGDVVALEAALAVMSGLAPRTVRQALYCTDRRYLAAVCVRADLPASHYVALRMALELAESCLENGGRPREYSSDTVRFVQQQYERLLREPEKVEELLGSEPRMPSNSLLLH